jgi:isopenicillin-N epimerase
MIDHVSSHTALIFPIEKIVRALEFRGVETLVDGAHAPGMVRLNLSGLRPAFYAGNLHKWVCAPKGAGFLYVREDKQKEIGPPVISHGYNTPREGFTPFQDRFDWTGTFDPTAWFCVPAAIKFMQGLAPEGFAELRRRNHGLAAQARRLLCEMLQVSAPCPEAMLGAMATLPLPDKFQRIPKTCRIDPEQSLLYDDYGIEVPLLRLGNPEKRWFRISAQIYNSIEQYEYLANALLKIAPTGSSRGRMPVKRQGLYRGTEQAHFQRR